MIRIFTFVVFAAIGSQCFGQMKGSPEAYRAITQAMNAHNAQSNAQPNRGRYSGCQQPLYTEVISLGDYLKQHKIPVSSISQKYGVVVSVTLPAMSPLYKLGIREQDIIYRIDKKKIESKQQFDTWADTSEGGKEHVLSAKRLVDGKWKSAKFTLIFPEELTQQKRPLPAKKGDCPLMCVMAHVLKNSADWHEVECVVKSLSEQDIMRVDFVLHPYDDLLKLDGKETKDRQTTILSAMDNAHYKFKVFFAEDATNLGIEVVSVLFADGTTYDAPKSGGTIFIVPLQREQSEKRELMFFKKKFENGELKDRESGIQYEDVN